MANRRHILNTEEARIPMPQTMPEKADVHTRKTVWPCFLISMLLFLFAVPAWGGDKEKDEETLKNAAAVLQDTFNSTNVAPAVLEKADCILVLPSVKKGGFIIGGSGGRGAMSCRAGAKFDGAWSAPAMYSIGGASIGLQVGGSSTDFVLLIMGDKGVEAVLQDKTKMGSDATAAAGPSGATTASSSVGGADILTYARAKGLFAGVSLEGATLHQDGDANKRLYGKAISAREIVRANAVETPAGGQSLISLLNTKIPKHGN
jgi:lipid-binding SYLF domain-containing protein